MSPNTVNSMADEQNIDYMKLVKYHVFSEKHDLSSELFSTECYEKEK
jgi:hypothetical protein